MTKAEIQMIEKQQRRIEEDYRQKLQCLDATLAIKNKEIAQLNEENISLKSEILECKAEIQKSKDIITHLNMSLAGEE